MKSVGAFIIVLLIVFTFPISIPILLLVGVGGNKNSAQTSQKTNKKDGYDKIFPYFLLTKRAPTRKNFWKTYTSWIYWTEKIK